MASNQLNHQTKSTQVQKLNGSEFNRAEVDEKTITNIYYDCLERIFDFLDLESLLNLAQTCKRLQIAAAAKISDEYGRKCIIISPITWFAKIEFTADGRLLVLGLKPCLSFLRCFGPKLSHLHVIIQSENRYIDQYISQYCADTVTRIRFRNFHPRRFLFTKPFKKVEKLHLVRTLSLGNELQNMVKWFPNLRHLKIDTVYNYSSSFGVFFPQLERVTMFIEANYMYETSVYQETTVRNGRSRLTIDNAKDLLCANPQLSDVAIFSWSTGLPMTTLLNMISNNPSILMLLVSSNPTDITMDEIERLTSEHSCIVDLDLKGYPLTCADVIFIIRRLNSLKRISTYMKNRFEYDCLLDQKGNEWKSWIVHAMHAGGIYVTLDARN